MTKPLHETVAHLLAKHGLTIALAESCTGGLVSHLLTEVPGISANLLESIVAYSNESKVKRLGVNDKTILERGAVSEEVASEMSRGVREACGADIGVALTGIAGPAGATPGKPVGLVFISVSTEDNTWIRQFQFTGSRSDIKRQASNNALDMVRLTILQRFAKGRAD